MRQKRHAVRVVVERPLEYSSGVHVIFKKSNDTRPSRVLTRDKPGNKRSRGRAGYTRATTDETIL